MIQRALRGDLTYFTWVGCLIALCGLAVFVFVRQFTEGLGITAMSRDVPWGFYIAQLTFLVGVAASAVMVVLPYYLHDYRTFRHMTILGESLAIPAVLLCPLFVVVDLGRPERVLNLFLHPSPHSMLFWDTIALFGYLFLNIVIAFKTLEAERNERPPARWVKILIYISIPWAISIHTVTAFLYSGLAARPFWFSAVLVPRFLASAFASGPALLILLSLLVRRVSRFDPGLKAVHALARIVTYAALINLFLFGVEVFTILYSGVEHHKVHLQYLFVGLDGRIDAVVPFMWLSLGLGIAAIALLIHPGTRGNLRMLAVACVFLFVSIWLDKGAGMLTGGLIPSTTGRVTPYFPSGAEILMGIGLYAFGALVLTLLYKIAVSVKLETVGNAQNRRDTSDL
ncbi:menaquinol oxidoreductase [bacterium]|nr:menaquinol oxidoreductase [bacterium]